MSAHRSDLRNKAAVCVFDLKIRSVLMSWELLMLVTL